MDHYSSAPFVIVKLVSIDLPTRRLVEHLMFFVSLEGISLRTVGRRLKFDPTNKVISF